MPAQKNRKRPRISGGRRAVTLCNKAAIDYLRLDRIYQFGFQFGSGPFTWRTEISAVRWLEKTRGMAAREWLSVRWFFALEPTAVCPAQSMARRMRKTVASFAIFLMAFAAVFRGVAIPIVHAHEHMAPAPVHAVAGASAADAACDPAGHGASSAAADEACDSIAHEHAPDPSKAKPDSGACSGNGACCGVVLSLDTPSATAPAKAEAERARIVPLTGVAPVRLDRPPSRSSV